MTEEAERQPSIMVVEDEPVVALNLQRTIKKLGYAVVAVAESGRKAIRLAEECSPDLIVMDIKLKGRMDGIETANQIGLKSQTPVVFLTAHGDDATIARAKAARPYGFLTKPFRSEELKAAVTLALEQHRVRREFFPERARLVKLLHNIKDGVIGTDTEGRVRYMNPAAEQLTGWKFGHAAGRNIEDVYRVTTMEGERVELCHLRQALTGHAPAVRARFQLLAADGHNTAIEESASTIFERGQIAGAITIFSGIADRLLYERRETRKREKLEEKVEATTEALGQTRAELRALSAHLINTQEEERLRISRELHDNLGQRAALIEMETRQLSRLVAGKDDDAPGLLNAIIGHAGAIRNGIRELAHSLHPSVLAELGLKVALQSLVEDFRLAGATIGLQANKIAPGMPPETVMTFYRIAQEALLNAMRHAPGALIRVSLSQTMKETHMIIEDKGPGFDSNQARTKPGLGLISMSERARLAGGTLLLRTSPGKGTFIMVQIPR